VIHPKPTTHRDRKHLDLAHQIHTCMLQLPTICKGYTVEGCEPAHGNWSWLGKGLSHKATDAAFCAACHNCHAELDQGRLLSREYKEEAWMRGAVRTWIYLMESGLLAPAGKAHV